MAAFAFPQSHTAIFNQAEGARLLEMVYRLPSGTTVDWVPSSSDLRMADGAFLAFLDSEEERKLNGPALPIDWNMYHRQIAGITFNGRKMLIISYAFSLGMFEPARHKEREEEAAMRGRSYDPDWWHHYPIVVHDGGCGYFRVVYDTESMKYVLYEQNGDA